MQRMTLTEQERQVAIRYFQQGKEPDFNLQDTLQEFARHARHRYELRVMFLELLLDAAVIDGTLSVGEDAILERVRTALKIPVKVFVAMVRAHEREPDPRRRSYRRPATPRVHSLSQSYAELGLKEDASAQEVKRAYRKLVSQYHPDKLMSQGLPEEIMDMAKRRVREVNAAYDRIKASKGIK